MLDAFPYALTVPAVWVAILLQIADVVTTLFVLSLPGGFESNPVVARVIAATGRAWPLIKLGVTGAAIVALADVPVIVWAINAGMAWVIWHNLGVIRRQRRRGDG